MKKTIVGLLLIVTVLATIPSTFAYDTSIKVKNKTIMIDVSHGAYHTSVENFKGNLTEAKNTVVMLESDLLTNFTADADALFMSGPDEMYTGEETQKIKDWFNQGGKFLFIGGDSDYGGYFSPVAINNLLRNLGANIRLDSTSISDETNNDGASYRVAATQPGTGDVATKVTEGMEAGFILHGPCSILGINTTTAVPEYLDLRTATLPNVEILYKYSAVAVATDSDVSELPTDLYAESETEGNYPAVVLETIGNSYLVLAGEAIFTDYKSMYDQFTETGEYNDGVTYGQMFVNNLINYFLGEAQAPLPIVPVVAALALFGGVLVIVRRRK
ncbi:MAG: hypothetical protein K9W46_06175 [Candidatus Heimdallarchaeum endolithica]|uniref:DUF4350 domain-containing protein n=1 Tax=Candidatus Heimdallarchaeum endolithica TaxID=2876572 RepID=A0A9Y1BU03_9ARCH|nr:MAG: hypothetical protein K9W46_06175 [Candidatus Heimdallarchaeum endolithica]